MIHDVSFFLNLRLFFKKHGDLLAVIVVFSFFRGEVFSWAPSLIYLGSLMGWILLIHTTWFTVLRHRFLPLFQSLSYWITFFTFFFIACYSFLLLKFPSFLSLRSQELSDIGFHLYNQLPFLLFFKLLYHFLNLPEQPTKTQRWVAHFPTSYRTVDSFPSFSFFSIYYFLCLFLIFMDAESFLKKFPPYPFGTGTFFFAAFVLFVFGQFLIHPFNSFSERYPSFSFKEGFKASPVSSFILFLLCVALSFSVTFLVHRFKNEDFLSQYFQLNPTNTQYSKTRMYQTGRIQLGQALMFRVKASQPLSSPFYLRDHSFNHLISNEATSENPFGVYLWSAKTDSTSSPSSTASGHSAFLMSLPYQDSYQFSPDYLPSSPESSDSSFSGAFPLKEDVIAGTSSSHRKQRPSDATLSIEFNRALQRLPLPEHFQTIDSLSRPPSISLGLDALHLPLLSRASPSLFYRVSYSSKAPDPQQPPIDLDRQVPEQLRLSLLKWLEDESLNQQGTPDEIAQRLQEHFLKHWTYTLDLSTPEGKPRGLMTFLTQDRRGHCEFYATAMTLLLRSMGISARYTTGYLVDEYHPGEDRYWVRESNGHAWVSYWNGQDWTSIDATPTTRSDQPDPASFFQPLLDAMDEFFYAFNQWSFPSFSDTRFSFLMGIPLCLIGLLLYRFTRLTRSSDQALDQLLHFLASQTGLQRDPLETSCDYLARLLPLLPSDCHELMSALILQRQAELFLPSAAVIGHPDHSSSLLAQQLLAYFRHRSSFRAFFLQKFFSITLRLRQLIQKNKLTR